MKINFKLQTRYHIYRLVQCACVVFTYIIIIITCNHPVLSIRNHSPCVRQTYAALSTNAAYAYPMNERAHCSALCFPGAEQVFTCAGS